MLPSLPELERRELLLRGVLGGEEEAGPPYPGSAQGGAEERRGQARDPLLDPDHYEVLPPILLEDGEGDEDEEGEGLVDLGVPSPDLTQPGQHTPQHGPPQQPPRTYRKFSNRTHFFRF